MTVAREYFQRVLSPWVPGVDNPVPRLVTEFANPQGLAVDVGCGPGVLSCYLAQHFGRVIAIDRDPGMIEAATELAQKVSKQASDFGEIEFRHEDWGNCEDIRGADLVCAINSILEPREIKRRLLFENIFNSLRQGPNPGCLLAIFPAMEAQIRLLRLYAADLERSGLNEEEIENEIEEEFLTAHHFDALEGTFSSRDEPTQKFYYQLELAWELSDAGFVTEAQSRVIYPWEVCRQVDAGYFPGELELWDWFIQATPALFRQ